MVSDQVDTEKNVHMFHTTCPTMMEHFYRKLIDNKNYLCIDVTKFMDL